MTGGQDLMQRVEQVMALRAGGMTVAAIARLLDCSTWRVSQAINVAEARRLSGRRALEPEAALPSEEIEASPRSVRRQDPTVPERACGIQGMRGLSGADAVQRSARAVGPPGARPRQDGCDVL